MPTEAEILQEKLEARERELAEERMQSRQIAQAALQQLTTVQQPQGDPNDPQVLERRNRMAEIEQVTQRGMGMLAQQYYQMEREKNRRTAQRDPALKEIMDEYGKEIEQMISNQPLDAQGHPEAYETACKAIRAKYFDKFVDKEHQRRLSAAEAERRAQAGEPEEEEELSLLDEEEEVEPEREAADLTEDEIEERLAARHRAKGKTPPPAPAASRALGGTARTPKRKFQPLDPEEKKWAKRFGMNDEEYDRYSHNLTTDFLGIRKGGKGGLGYV